jgi:hypothetical protein
MLRCCKTGGVKEGLTHASHGVHPSQALATCIHQHWMLSSHEFFSLETEKRNDLTSSTKSCGQQQQSI